MFYILYVEVSHPCLFFLAFFVFYILFLKFRIPSQTTSHNHMAVTFIICEEVHVKLQCECGSVFVVSHSRGETGFLSSTCKFMKKKQLNMLNDNIKPIY